MESASKTVGSYLNNGDIVIYESTVYPGMTEEICVPILEISSGLKYNKEFFCGYSPERINPGDKKHKIADIVKDGEIIRDARELAFELVKLDPNLCKPFNRDIKEVFAKKYSHHLENLKLI